MCIARVSSSAPAQNATKTHNKILKTSKIHTATATHSPVYGVTLPDFGVWGQGLIIKKGGSKVVACRSLLRCGNHMLLLQLMDPEPQTLSPAFQTSARMTHTVLLKASCHMPWTLPEKQ